MKDTIRIMTTMPLHTFIYFLKHQNYGYEEMKEFIRYNMKDTIPWEQVDKDGGEIYRECEFFYSNTSSYNPYHKLCFLEKMYNYISWNKGLDICHRFNKVDKFDKDCICTEELFILISKYDLPTDDFEEIMTNLQEIDKLMRGQNLKKVYAPKAPPDVINLYDISSYEEWYAKDGSDLQKKIDEVKEKRDNYLEEIKRREDAMREEVAEGLETQVEADETQEATKTIQDVEPSEVETHYKEIAKILKPYVSHCSVDKIKTIVEYKISRSGLGLIPNNQYIVLRHKFPGDLMSTDRDLYRLAECFCLTKQEAEKFIRHGTEDNKRKKVDFSQIRKNLIKPTDGFQYRRALVDVRENHLHKINPSKFKLLKK